MIEQKFPKIAESTLGSRIRKARLTRGFTLERLAGAIGVSKVSVWQWEAGRSRPRLATLELLSDALGMSTADLLNDNEPRASGDAVASLIADCRGKIARAVGVGADSIEIKISFSGMAPLEEQARA